MALPKSTLISLNSSQGTTMILEACAANYPALRQNFEGQINGGFCGVASSVIIVNSLQYLRQADKKQKVTQESIFKISGIELLPEWIYGGITLAYLASLIQGACNALKIHVKISIAYGDKFSSLDEFRNFLLRIMSTDGVFAMANYRRQSIGVGASPHMSPIGAYHKDSDMLMILDTNSKYYESAWVPLHLMFDAIKTIDHHANKSRGILLAQLLK